MNNVQNWFVCEMYPNNNNKFGVHNHWFNTFNVSVSVSKTSELIFTNLQGESKQVEITLVILHHFIMFTNFLLLLNYVVLMI